MRRVILAAMIPVAVAATGVVAAPAGAADVAPMQVVVTNRGGGALKGAEVTISRGDVLVAREIADARGSVSVPLFAGEYKVIAKFDSICATTTSVAATVAHVTGAARRVDLTIDGVSVVSGRLTADGVAADGARVHAYHFGESWYDLYRDLGVSDADGRFAFEVCPEEAYVVSAVPPRTTSGYFTTYFGDVTRDADATTVSAPPHGLATPAQDEQRDAQVMPHR